MITVHNLSKTIRTRPVLQDVSFVVPDGSITGFVGPNGAGKSTTMRIMLGLDHATSGSAHFNGFEYRRLTDPLREVGSLLDAKALIPNLRSRDLLDYCARTQGIRPRGSELLEQVGLAGVEAKRVSQLSLGMRQRLGIAAALIASPTHLVLDEPLNGLDPSGIAWLREFLPELSSRGCAILLSSHVISELARIADDIVVISEGRVVLRGPLAAFSQQGAQRVLARTDQPDELLAAVRSHNGSAHHAPSGPVVITGLVADSVFALAATHGITLTELTTSTRTLDDIYRDAVSRPSTEPS